MSTIPASQLVNVIPGVVQAAGNAFNLSGLFITNSTRVPIGTVATFAEADDVLDYFGPGTEYNWAVIYFNGFTGAQAVPANLLYAQYNASAVAGYLRGGNVSGLSLTALQAISGTLSVVVDGATYTNASVSLSAATSFSNAAGIIQTALNAAPPNEATVTGTIATTTLTVSAVASGTLAPGQLITGASVTANSVILTQLTSTETDGSLGGKGTYHLSQSSTVGSGETITATAVLGVSYDSVSGAFVLTSGVTGPASTIAYATGTTAVPLALTSATGAVLSQGAAAVASQASYMNAIEAITGNWATFALTFDPDGGAGNTIKLAFAAWNNGQNDQYLYVAWDTDVLPANENPDTTSLAYLVFVTNDYSGTGVFSDPQSIGIAPFVSGWAASLDFDQLNGRTTLAGRSQTGLAATVNNGQAATNLLANHYSFYGAYASRTTQFICMQNGAVSGPFRWADTYVNQIWLNAEFTDDLIQLILNTGSIPYTPPGYAMIETSLLPTINQALNFGAIRAGVTLSGTQIADLNAAAGVQAAPTVQARGWYLQILDPDPSVRQARGTPVINFWYADGESVQKITMNSIALL